MSRVLIVDDHEDQCRVLTLLLKHLGHEAWCVTSAEDAIQFMLKGTIDLLISDVMMPGIDGMELLAMIRRTQASNRLPVVLYSAVSDPLFQQYAIGKGANDYIVKGVDLAQLEQRLGPYLVPPSVC